jgi:hypothetical protein
MFDRRREDLPRFDEVAGGIEHVVDLGAVPGPLERTQDRAGIGSMTADEVEHCQAAVVADDRLAVDDARADRQRLDRLSDTRKAIRKVVAIAGEKPNIAPAPIRQDPEAVVLDLVNPARARRRLAGRSRQAWFEAEKGLLGAHSTPKFTRC